MEVTGTKTLSRLQNLVATLKLSGTVTGAVGAGGRVEYRLAGKLIGKSAPEARKALKSMK